MKKPTNKWNGVRVPKWNKRTSSRKQKMINIYRAITPHLPCEKMGRYPFIVKI